MLTAELKAQLASYLQRLTAPVELVAALDGSATAAEMRELLDALAQLSPQVGVRVESGSPGDASGAADGVLRPSFSVGRPGERAGIRFAGVPMGHEFTSLVLALLQVGGYPPKGEEQLLEQARRLPGEYVFETFISLTCQNCPDVVQALNLLAVLNPNVRHTMIDGALFGQEVERREVMAVPTVLLNGQPFGQGRMSLAEILAKLDTGAAARASAELSQRAPYDMLIVGGGPAGAAAAIYAARKGIRTGVAADRFGGQVLDTMGIENFISVRETEGPKLVTALEQHVRDYQVDIMDLQRAAALKPASPATGGLHEITLKDGATLKAKSVVIATGARWREINVPGEREYRNRGVAYCPHCDGPLFKAKPVAVIGGGNSGVEAAIDLAGIVSHVTLVEYDAQLRADAVLVDKLKSLANVTIITSAQTTEVKGDGQRVVSLAYREREGGALREVALAGVFVQIGLVPNTDWLKGTLQLSPRGEVIVDARGQTSVPGVFAAGDCTTVPYKQIIIAMGEGAKASLGAFEHLMRAPVARDVEREVAAA
jgi:NADH-dependent peroxiredoxin subunit F